MRNLLTLTLFLLAVLSSAATAQKIRFTDAKNLWTTEGHSGMEGCWYSCYGQYSGDTAALGFTYKKLVFSNSTIFYPPGCFPSSSYASKLMIREDTSAGMVYYRSYWDTTERVMYNYNLQAGDTISYKVSGNIYIDSVISVDSVSISGIYHKVWQLYGWNSLATVHNPTMPQRKYTVIEGVGATGGPTSPSYMPSCFEMSEQLECFSQIGTIPPTFSVPYNLCYADFMFSNCTSLGLSASPTKDAVISIWPNPANTILHVTAAAPISHLTITDITGSRIYNYTDLPKDAELDIHALPPGMYIVRIDGDTQRFVKQ